MTTETWHDTPPSSASRTITMLYDAANNLLDATDRLGTSGAVQSKYAATYDRLGRATSVTNAGTPGHPTVQTDSTFNAASERTQLAIPGASGLTNNYQYDTLSRMTRIEQTGAAAAKLVTLTYNKVSQFTGISRYSDIGGANLVARADYAYETSGATSLSHRLTTMTYTGAAALATYSWGWDPADRITQQTIVSKLTTTITSTETSSYGYNFRNELTGATHNGFTPNEGYVYDGTGNRVNAPYGPPDPNNELKFDGTYTYTYDNEGNRTEKRSGATVVGTFNYDHRNRLTRATNGTAVVEYQYDLMDRRILRVVAGGATQRFGYDGDTIALEFDGANTLTHRYLHGPVIDQVFADEAVGVATRWTLTDHLGTVREVVDNSGANQKHIQYDSFGKRLTAVGGVEVLYSWTGREYDAEVDLQYNRARWYDPKVGRWLSTDPIGFDAGDSNLYRYVHNQPTLHNDPSGLQAGSTIERDRIIPKDVKTVDVKAEGIEKDLYFDVQFLDKGQEFKYYYQAASGKKESNQRPTGDLTYTFERGDRRVFSEAVYVVITLKSKSGKEVRGLHLRQDIVNRWHKQADGKVVDQGVKLKDYASATDKTNLLYGGWWLYDTPERERDTTDKAAFGTVYTHVFWQAHVFVEENPSIKMYWGWYVHADFAKKGADTDAVVERKTFGPVSEPMNNPFLEKKK